MNSIKVSFFLVLVNLVIAFSACDNSSTNISKDNNKYLDINIVGVKDIKYMIGDTVHIEVRNKLEDTVKYTLGLDYFDNNGRWGLAYSDVKLPFEARLQQEHKLGGNGQKQHFLL